MREASSAEGGDRAPGPVNLVQVDVVSAQATQTTVGGRDDVRPIQAPIRSPQVHQVSGRISRTRHLSRHDHLTSYPARSDPLAQDLFGRALCFGQYGSRIVFSRVEKIDAGCECQVQLPKCILLCGLRAERHHPEPSGTHPQIAPPKSSELGRSSLDDAVLRHDWRARMRLQAHLVSVDSKRDGNKAASCRYWTTDTPVT